MQTVKSLGPFLAILASLMLSSCRTAETAAPDSETKVVDLENSQYLMQAGDRAKAYVYDLIEKRNEFAKANNFVVKFEVMDARDPRLYPPGAPIQPPSPAEKALVKVAADGRFMIVALIQDQPGFFKLKEFPTGNKITEIEYGVEKIAYSSRFDGLFASVGRVTSGNGWMYIYYVRGWGNNVNPQQFDNNVAVFLQNTVLYVTPLFANEAPKRFAPKRNN